MLSLRCRINANVAELLVIIGYSELGPTLGARPFARSLGRLPARLLSPHPPHPLLSTPLIPRLWFTLGSLARLTRLSGLSPGCLAASLPRCRGSHWRASRWTESAPNHFNARSLSIHTIRTAIRDQLERIFDCSRSIENAILYLPRNV